MDTKRCTNCHKLLRAETEVCSRCGYTFTEKKQLTPVRTMVKRSIPPASPHRAGHYSGLHPEDQPYQSTMIAVQRPPERQSNLRGAVQPERERVALPRVDSIVEPEPDQQATVPLLPPRFSFPPRSSLLKKSWPRGRFVPVMLIISFLIFLVASSLLAFIFISKKPLPDK